MSLCFSFFSLCLSNSRPRSFTSLGFSSNRSLTLCFSLCFLLRDISSCTGGGGLGVRGPFFLLWLFFELLCCSKRGEDTVEVFFSLLLADVEDLGLDLSFGDLLDFLGEGEEDTLDLTASGEISFLMTISSLFSMFSSSSFINSLWIFWRFISKESSWS